MVLERLDRDRRQCALEIAKVIRFFGISDSCARGGAYWPLWLAKDLPNANVYTLGYPADVWAKWIEQAMSLYERAKAVLEQLAGMGLGSRPIALVCHSLGGLLAKQIIRTGNEADDSDWSAIASNTKFVAFLATPHSGSSVASTLKFLLPRTTSTTIETLKAGKHGMSGQVA